MEVLNATRSLDSSTTTTSPDLSSAISVAPFNVTTVAPFNSSVAPFNSSVAPVSITSVPHFNVTSVPSFNVTSVAPFNVTSVASFNVTSLAPFNTSEAPFNVTSVSGGSNETSLAEESWLPTDDASAHPLDLLAAHQAALLLARLCPPVLLLLGTWGNVLILLVLRRSPSSLPMSVLFSALAVSDLVLLYTVSIHLWIIAAFDLDLRLTHDVVCRLHVFCVYVSGMTSSWFLVAMTLQRVASVLWPHRVGLVFTRGRARVAVLLLVCGFGAVNAHYLVSLSLHEETDPSTNTTSMVCYIEADKVADLYYDRFVYPWIDLLLTSLIPSVVLLVGNSVLAVTVVRAARRATTMTSLASQADKNRNRKKAATSLTLTLISVSFMFLCLNTPVVLFLVLRNYDLIYANIDTWETYAEYELVWEVVNILWYLNSTLNFYVYILTGERFRSRCKQLLLCKLRGSRAEGSSMRLTYTTHAQSGGTAGGMDDVKDAKVEQDEEDEL